MHAQCSYDYAVIRVVPRVERQEFVNAGVILWCQEQDFLEARVELDEARLRTLDAAVDVDAVRRHLASFAIICAGGKRFRAHRQAVEARTLRLAGGAAQHDHPDIRGSHRTVHGCLRDAGAFARLDGAPREKGTGAEGAVPDLLAKGDGAFGACPLYSTRTEVSSEIISSMRSRSGIHGASLIMRTCEMMGVRSGKVLVGSGRRMSALTRTSCGKPCETMP